MILLQGQGLARTFADEVLFENITIHIQENSRIAIVGRNGTGKSTLLKLFLRQYDAGKEEILINGRSIQDYRIKDLRALMGYVPQEQILFAMSIKDNIRFGNPTLPDEAVIEATKICGLYDDIMAMPEGFDTLIGEKGVLLSGGQKRRHAVLRKAHPALYRHAHASLAGQHGHLLPGRKNSFFQRRLWPAFSI